SSNTACIGVASPQQGPHMEVVVIRDLPHVVVKDPLDGPAAIFLVGYQLEGLFHVGDLFWGDLDPMLAQDYHRHIARVTIENGETKRGMKLGVPWGVASKLA
ncbi:MAG: hypothetical protein ACREQ3_06925, partial [Candidatus Binatia bacterium]